MSEAEFWRLFADSWKPVKDYDDKEQNVADADDYGYDSDDFLKL